MNKRFIDYYTEAATKKSGGGGGSGPTIEAKTITENGSYQESGKAYSPVTVNVEPKLQQRNVTVTDNGMTVIKKTSSAYDGISQVNLTVDVQGGDEYTVEGDFQVDSSAAILGYTTVSVPRKYSGYIKEFHIEAVDLPDANRAASNKAILRLDAYKGNNTAPAYTSSSTANTIICSRLYKNTTSTTGIPSVSGAGSTMSGAYSTSTNPSNTLPIVFRPHITTGSLGERYSVALFAQQGQTNNPYFEEGIQYHYKAIFSEAEQA